MKKIILLTLVFSTFILAGCAQQNTTTVQSTNSKPTANINEKVSQSVKNICAQKNKDQCIGDCRDGYNEYCYFDSTKYKQAELIGDFEFPEEVKQSCIGIHTLSVCGNCQNKFELNEDGKLKEVSCEKFFQAVENYNKSCNDCIQEAWAGCC